MENQRTFPGEFDMIFAVDVYGSAVAIKMPDNFDMIMDGPYLNDNGFKGHKDLPQGLYKAHGKIWSHQDWETGIWDDFGVELTDIETIWTPEQEQEGEDEQSWETPCQSREDGTHCTCWHDGQPCCSCGAR